MMFGFIMLKNTYNKSFEKSKIETKRIKVD